MRYAFYSHGGCENHGCEAIVRTLSAMIKTVSPYSFIKLYTLDAQSDKAGDLPNIDETEEFNYTRPVSSLNFLQTLKISSLSRKSQKSADEYFYSLSCKNPSLIPPAPAKRSRKVTAVFPFRKSFLSAILRNTLRWSPFQGIGPKNPCNYTKV